LLRASQGGSLNFDRAVGGGFVPGSVLSLGGDPGIGKSFLLIQIWARLAATYRRVVYISGEEGVDQVRLRAILRLGLLPGA
jgi:DNA repair protein RadA/Sms